MIIRSITYTIDLRKVNNAKYLQSVTHNINVIKKEYAQKKINIRTIRFNIIALNKFDNFNEKEFLVSLETLSKFSKELGLRWFNISFDLINQAHKEVDYVCGLSLLILKTFENAFVNHIVAKDYIHNYAVLRSAELIKRVALLSANGIDNFRFGVSLNMEVNTPFFPFSYSNTNDSFSIAVETTKEFVSIIKKDFTGDYEAIKESLINNIAIDLIEIEFLANTLASDLNLQYHGQDISLSPYPEENISVIEILNLLGVRYFGSNGTQFMTSYLTSILKEIIIQHNLKAVGFNGVMYSLLEDKLMCKANNEENFNIDSVILYSTVCGCGLDMLPLPGDVKAEEIASMILDVATTSIKLNKPLGVRVLPIQEKCMGEKTELELDFLTNTNIPKIKHLFIDKSLFSLTKFFVKI